MRKKNRINILNKQTIKSSKFIIFILFLMTSIIFMGIKSSQANNVFFQPKTIWGYVTYNNGEIIVGVSVVVNATGFPNETDTTDSDGAYQVDIGHDGGGIEWPNDTIFTVTAIKSGWKGSNTGIVIGTYTQCDVNLVKAKSIEHPVFHWFFEQLIQRFTIFEKILNQHL